MHLKALITQPAQTGRGAPARETRTHRLIKTILLMKLMVVLTLVACLQVQARSYGQQITLSEKGATLEKIFRSVYRQTGYQFIYNNEVLQAAHRIDIRVKDASLEEVLRICSLDQPVEYVIRDRVIVVRAKQVHTSEQGADTVRPRFFADTGRVLQGQVVEQSGSVVIPLGGVSIYARKAGKGTQSDVRGGFRLQHIKDDDVLEISCIGYERQVIKVNGKSDLYIGLKPAVDELDKTVVQGYGKTSRRLATGNIGRVSAEEIEKQPVTNPLMALQGRIPGVQITPNSGYASDMIRVEIRGRNTLNPDIPSEPLYIVDDIPITVLNVNGGDYSNGARGYAQNQVASPAWGQSPLYGMNPLDIESIEVLKDADATAIYGSRGANGVVLITTKKGKAGKTAFNVGYSQGFSRVTRHWKMMNTKEYLAMRREALQNDGLVPSVLNAPDIFLLDSNRNVDWQKEIWGRTGKSSTLVADLSGGDARTNFRLSGMYGKNTSILAASGSNVLSNLDFSLQHHSLNRKLSLDFHGTYIYTRSDMVSMPANAVTLPPNAPAIYNKDGDLNFDGWNAAGDVLAARFSFNVLRQPYSIKTNELRTNMSLNWEMLRGLQLRLVAGYNNVQTANQNLVPLSSLNPLQYRLSYAQFGTVSNLNMTVGPQISYSGYIGKGNLTLLVAGNLQSTRTDGNSVTGFGYASDDFIQTILGAQISVPYRAYGEYAAAGLLGRINYNWENKYILNFNIRRDGSSRFGPGRQYGTFKSVGAAWNATDETWMRKLLPDWVSFVKLRGSYGTTGNDAVGDYQYLSQWSSQTGGGPLYTYQGIVPLVNTHATNPDYQWQETKELEGGLSLSFLKNRLNLEMSWYQKRCDNQLLQYPTAMITGFDGVTANWPANVQNTGFEAVLDGRIIDHKDFRWTFSWNIGINRNKLLSYPDLDLSPYATKYQVGKPLNMWNVLHYTGVDPQTGAYTFQDYNKDGKIMVDNSVFPGTKDDDRYVAINRDPVYFGGFGNNLTWKQFRFSFYFQYVKQRGKSAFVQSQPPGGLFNQPVLYVGNHWTKPGDVKKYGRYSTVSSADQVNYGNNSDAGYMDASFIKLQNIEIAYQFSGRWMKKAGLQGGKFSITANNLFVITRYDGVDPETQVFGSMPQAKQISTNIYFNF